VTQFAKKHAQTKGYLALVQGLLLLTMLLETVAYMIKTDNYEHLWTKEFDIKLAALVISFITDMTMIYLLWFYLIYFFKKKKQMLSKQRK